MLGALIGLGGSLVGGWLQNRKIGQAADLQRVAATEAKDLVGTQLGEANRPIADATAAAQQGVTTAANYAVDTAGAGANRAIDTASRSNAILDPYSQAGGTAANYLNGAVAEGGDFNRRATLQDIQMDPGYAFRQQQGELALSRSAAARGGAMSGGALKDLANYSQGLASQEYQNAFDRYQTDTAQRYARLFGTAGMGLDAGTTQAGNLNTAARYAGDINMQGAGMGLQGATTVGEFGQRGAAGISGNIMDAARTQADIITGRGNAEGAAKIAGGNAWGGAIANGANTVGSAMIYKDIFKNPAVKKVN
jgi:hypothetical protein